MGGRSTRGGANVRWVMIACALAFLGSGCAAPRRNPFGQGEGPISITVVNNGRSAISVMLRGLDRPITLGVFSSGERGRVEIQLDGRAEISARIARLNGEDSYLTFRSRAEPGDRFILQVGNDLHRARLIRVPMP